MSNTEKMTSNRPYLVRAMYDWICDNGLTPYLLVDAGQNRVRFHARFGGVSQHVDVPMPAVLAIYAQENGQGMMFPVEAEGDVLPSSETPAEPEKPVRKGPGLRIVK